MGRSSDSEKQSGKTEFLLLTYICRNSHIDISSTLTFNPQLDAPNRYNWTDKQLFKQKRGGIIMRILSAFHNSTLGRSLRVFPKKDVRKIAITTLLQIFLGLLDLVGVATIGVLGALAVNGIQSRQPGNRVTEVLKILHLDGYTFQTQAAILGGTAALVLILRTIATIFISRRILFFLSRRAAVLSTDLISRLLRRNILEIQEKTSQETLYAVTNGVSAITLGIVGASVSIASDLAILLFLTVGLFVVDPAIAIGTFIIFGVVGFLLFKLLQQRALKLGQEASSLTIESNERILEVLNSYREFIVRNRRRYYADQISAGRMALANNQAEVGFMPYISKYVIETTVVFGTLAISALQFLTTDATHAVATLSVFMASGTRIAPAVLRLQQGALQIKGSLGAATPTLALIERFDIDLVIDDESEDLDLIHEGFSGTITVENVDFTYPEKRSPAANSINLHVAEGKSLAVVGTSGAGKTTLIDLMLGILDPSRGQVLISGVRPLDAIKKWPGAVAYVPQDVMITNGTIRENVALGFPKESATDNLVWNALRIAQLEDHVKDLPMQLDSPVGERGTKLSGGQRQRLGIARALFTNPKLIILDEATSSLDEKTELEFANAIHELSGRVTVVIIAHRLSTVREANEIAYLENGRIISLGDFDMIRSQIPDFDIQSKLMGY
jgi:ATP-binding cassette subfamily C protein